MIYVIDNIYIAVCGLLMYDAIVSGYINVPREGKRFEKEGHHL